MKSLSKNLVITIGREFGSGGHEIARRLSEKMGIKMYDKEIISIVAKNHGYSEEVLNDIDEKASNSLLYALSTGAYTHHTHLVSGLHIPLNDKAFMAYAEVIKELAEKESCIIVGRCADSILKDHENLFRVFIHTDLERRVDRICEFEKIDRNEALSIIKKRDKKRSGYHNYYADTKWGAVKTYDLCIDSKIGIDKVVEIIKYAAEHK